MSEEENNQDLNEITEFQQMLIRSQEEALRDLDADDVSSLNILIQLAEPHANTMDELQAIRHLKKRVNQL